MQPSSGRPKVAVDGQGGRRACRTEKSQLVACPVNAGSIVLKYCPGRHVPNSGLVLQSMQH